MLFELLTELVKTDDILFVVKDDCDAAAAISEIRSGGTLGVRQKSKWITIGSNDDPAHMHINSELVSYAEFIQEKKPNSQRISFSVRFHDKEQRRVLAAFFTKMYDDESTMIIGQRLDAYERLKNKYSPSSRILF